MEVLKRINEFLWNFPMLFLLLGTHLFFTFRLHFIQKKVFKGIKYSITPEKSGKGDLSGFAALATTLAATLGTGNIIGVSTAIALGGPGALFWCWITGILGMATSYAESYLCILFRRQNKDGSYIGGPMYFLQDGLGKKGLAVFYAICTMLASFGVGCTTQSNAITTTTKSLWGFSPYIVGFVIAIPIGFVLIGGIKSIGKVCTKLVPAMGAFYIVACIIILTKNAAFITDAITLILESAFTKTSFAGGLIAASLQTACRYGIARGLFTNEAGLGTAGIAASSAITKNPKRQALISMTATFWDTVVMCAITGLVIIIALLKDPLSAASYNIGEYTSIAFKELPFGETLLGFSLIAFAAATLLGWFYFGERATDYLFGKNGIKYYQLLYIVSIYIGAVMSLELVWELTDFINAFMAVPCIIGLLFLNKKIK
ncbi:MAG: amino acid carrier protein [bacterium]|nr:amino acid carrier protein [bacterium]